jgi:hypothetical protein
MPAKAAGPGGLCRLCHLIDELYHILVYEDGQKPVLEFIDLSKISVDPYRVGKSIGSSG